MDIPRNDPWNVCTIETTKPSKYDKEFTVQLILEHPLAGTCRIANPTSLDVRKLLVEVFRDVINADDNDAMSTEIVKNRICRLALMAYVPYEMYRFFQKRACSSEKPMWSTYIYAVWLCRLGKTNEAYCLATAIVRIIADTDTYTYLHVLCDDILMFTGMYGYRERLIEKSRLGNDIAYLANLCLAISPRTYQNDQNDQNMDVRIESLDRISRMMLVGGYALARMIILIYMSMGMVDEARDFVSDTVDLLVIDLQERWWLVKCYLEHAAQLAKCQQDYVEMQDDKMIDIINEYFDTYPMAGQESTLSIIRKVYASFESS